MDELLTIGEFAARCGLSRSALRFYDHTALLCPCSVDADTGYRYYAGGQLETTLLIRRLRAAELPVELVREYLVADGARRRTMLDAHARAFRARARSVQAAVRELHASAADGEDGRWCAVAATVLADALAQVAFAVARPGGRPELGVIWVETREQSLRLVSTDSYRLAVRDLVPAALGPAPIRGAIDGPGAARLAGGRPGAHTLTLRQDGGGALTAIVEDRAEVVGGAGEGFPDYARILDGLPLGGKVAVGREELAAALRELAPDVTPVRLRFGAAGLAVAAGDGVGRPVGGAWSGASLEVALERAFLAEALQATVGPDVVIEAVGPRQPVTLRSADTGTFSVLTMPVAPADAG